ncbi:transferase family-domain-containing protein [Mycena vitilis]|nr:transferase family-domain-containing protein [Mycena vitilis]
MTRIIPTSSSRVFPEERASTRTVELSILDAAAGNFDATAAAWVYDLPTDHGKSALSPVQLRRSLAKTLNAYPHWAGQLKNTTYIPGGNHTSRSGRLQVTYGAPTDPGVEFVEASSEEDVVTLFPSGEERTSGFAALDITSIGALNLLPCSPALASESHNGGDFTGLPSLVVQVTSFKCGGVVVALKSSHPLADAQSLTTFVHDWAVVNRALVQNLPLPALAPSFSPAALDQAAAGDIDAASPDPQILKIARKLLIHRYDWWASADGCPPGALESTKVPPHLASLTNIELGQPIPWRDLQGPVANFLLYFSAAELTRIRAAAASPGQPISHFDALQAHLWSVLIRARAPNSPGEQFHFNVALGVRDRVTPPLGAHALGSPIVVGRVSGTARCSLPQLARTIREMVGDFTPERVGALLHEMAFDLDLRRMWAWFIGRRNTLVTSWLRHGVYEVDFGGGRPRFVHGVLPAMDGIIQVMEAMPRCSAAGSWHQAGASVSLMLTREIIQKMLKDPVLRKYQ